MPEPRAGSPWGVHDHPDAHQAERRAGEVEAVGAEPVDEHTPGEPPISASAASTKSSSDPRTDIPGRQVSGRRKKSSRIRRAASSSGTDASQWISSPARLIAKVKN